MLQIDPLIKVNYISTAPGGLVHTSNTCMNSSAVYVTCPDLLCGTRVLTASQLLREVGYSCRVYLVKAVGAKFIIMFNYVHDYLSLVSLCVLACDFVCFSVISSLRLL